MTHNEAAHFIKNIVTLTLDNNDSKALVDIEKVDNTMRAMMRWPTLHSGLSKAAHWAIELTKKHNFDFEVTCAYNHYACTLMFILRKDNEIFSILEIEDA